MEESLLNSNQSGFRPGDSCINQLLAITHEIFDAFDCNPSLEVRSEFLDISKAFDKVWHEGLLHKINSMDISGELYSLLESYLYKVSRKDCFKWTNVIMKTSFDRFSLRLNIRSTSFSRLH